MASDTDINLFDTEVGKFVLQFQHESFDACGRLSHVVDASTPDAAARLLHLFGYDGERAPTVLFPDHPHQMRSAQIDRYYIVRHHKFIF